ncbi:MAG: hypothetical protein H6623_03125 [Bdellovibrionaceae bacterium]|nr:hypothetical protein [Pseudobdellovibrionaceae bacterium]
MHKSLLAMLLSLFLVLSLSARAEKAATDGGDDDDETPSREKSCEKALEKAYDRVLSVRNSNAQAVVQPAANQQNQNGQQSTGNPITDMANKMAQGDQKMAELQKQQLEQMHKVDQEQAKQMEKIDDKIHEFQRADYDRRMKIKEAESAKRQTDSKIRKQCRANANTNYAKLLEINSGLAAKTTYKVTSMSQASGTRARLKQKKKDFYNECMVDPSTQEDLSSAEDELNTKLNNFKIKREEILSDVAYQEAKIPKMLAQMDDERRYIAQSTAMQANAIEKAQQQAMMGMAFAMMTSLTNSNGRVQAAGTSQNSNDILNRWPSIKSICMNEQQAQPEEVPSDLLGIFDPVNKACRPLAAKEGREGCVRSSGRQSFTPRSNIQGASQ